GLYVGGGMYMPDPPTLARLRAAIGDETSGRQLVRIVAALRKRGYSVDTHDALRSAPKGFRADHPRIDLLRMKDIFAGKAFKPSAWLSTREALTRIATVMIDIRPLAEWLDRHLA